MVTAVGPTRRWSNASIACHFTGRGGRRRTLRGAHDRVCRTERGSPDRLDAYTAVVQAAEIPTIAQQGIDVSGQRPVANGIELDMVLDQAQADRLRGQGVDLKLTRVKGGLTVQEFAAEQAANGFTVWRSYDEAGGIRDQLYAAARNNPQLVKLEVLGHTGQGREIIAVKLTQGAQAQPDGTRPAVLYSSTQHAREWISTEVNRRLMNHYIDRWRANDREVRKLLQTTELWFILVANPDGYQYTFDHERLWRKNLRDNNGDGQTQVGDGVDPNRNFPNHWGYDEEGSSSIQSSDTYRGPAPMSEPETQAMVGLLDRIGFAFQVNWHSNGQWLLYAEGWQTSTPTADDPIYYAMSGNLDDPAIDEFHPGLSSDVLYVTNGETTDYAHAVTGALAWTPELSAGCAGCGFVFPDDEALVQAEFERNLPFARSVADSAVDPDDPKTVTGITTKPFYVDSDDPYKRSNPGVQLSFARSYGDPQPVAVIAKRSLGAVTVKYRINGGAVQSAPTSEWEGGSRYNPASVYYHQMRGVVTGTDPGDSVEVWFEGGGQRSDSFTYQAVSESGNRVLVVAAEDYTGASPVQDPAGPHFVTQYTDALAANGQEADVYDIDAAGRMAPDALGVLSHYDAVIVGDRKRPGHPHRRPRWRQCRPAGTRRTARVPLVHERGRQGAPRRRLRRPAVHQRRRECPVVRPQGRDRLQPASRGYGPAALPALVRLVLRWRRHERRDAVLPGWLRCRGQRRSRRRRRVRLDRRRRPVHGPRVGPRRSRLRR